MDRVRRARGTYEGSAREVNRTDGNRERRKENLRGEVDLMFDPGDEKAQVSATRGFKCWFSTKAAGLTVESTVTVTVRCGQSHKEITTAVTEAAKTAEGLAKAGSEQMGLYIDAFNEDQK